MKWFALKALVLGISPPLTFTVSARCAAAGRMIIARTFLCPGAAPKRRGGPKRWFIADRERLVDLPYLPAVFTAEGTKRRNP